MRHALVLQGACGPAAGALDPGQAHSHLGRVMHLAAAAVLLSTAYPQPIRGIQKVRTFQSDQKTFDQGKTTPAEGGAGNGRRPLHALDRRRAGLQVPFDGHGARFGGQRGLATRAGC